MRATSPEGIDQSMPLGSWLGEVAVPKLFTGDFIMPDGGKAVISRGNVVAIIHETPPNMHSLRWIAKNSPSPYGNGTKYRTVSIALPYLITVGVFEDGKKRGMQLTQCNECFFLNHPLRSLDEKDTAYPALLNLSKWPSPDGNPLAWICTQYLDFSQLRGITDKNEFMRRAMKELLRTLLGAAFNYSSEHHEGQSWFSETVKRKVDPRIESIESWEKNSKEDPLFVLDVPWVQTGYSVRGIVERIFQRLGVRESQARTTEDLARPVFNQLTA